MKAGYFNINEYLKKLNEGFGSEEDEEDEEEKEEKTGFISQKQNTPREDKGGFNTKTQGSAGKGGQLPNQEGLIIPEVNQKAYQWLKKEYHKAQVEVKVEMKIGDAKFEPGYDLQTDLDSVKDFKPGMFGEVRTVDTKGVEKTGEVNKTKNTLDTNKSSPSFGKQEGEKSIVKPDENSTKHTTIGTKSTVKPESGEHEDKEIASEKPEHKKENEKPEVKKIDLKTKKK